MKNTIKAPRGTKDIWGDELKYFEMIKENAFGVAENYGYKRIVTPTFESSDLFKRGVGETTDVVNKEMFYFEDRKGRELALRPEGTAGTIRAAIEEGLIEESLPLKLCYFENCFRNERPQAGRFKEFFQFGAELIGSKSYLADVEIITLAHSIFKRLKVDNLKLKLNSIGCNECRLKYKEELIKYYKDKEDKLCRNCKDRLYQNPLRLLDCKEKECIELKEDAPKIIDYLCHDCKENFDMVKLTLDNLLIPYEVDEYIVRGLDYYKGTVFEFVSNELGAQSAVCGGGRYDGLIELLGGKSLSSLGFAIGVERLSLILKAQNKIKLKEDRVDLFLGRIGEGALNILNEIAYKLRESGLSVYLEITDRSVKAQMKYANKINSKYSVIIGDSEIEKGSVNIKNMDKNESYEVSLDNFCEDLLNLI